LESLPTHDQRFPNPTTTHLMNLRPSHAAVIGGLLLLAACGDDTNAPQGTSPGSADSGSSQVLALA
jgi:hypothetical protein